MFERSSWVQFRNAFGLPLIQYVCNIDDQSVDALNEGRYDPLEPAQADALEKLTNLLEPHRREAAVRNFPKTWALQPFVVPPRANEPTPLDQLRLDAGGTLATLDPDGAAGILQRIARDMYPLLLAAAGATPSEWESMPIAMPLFRHPARDACFEAILRDPHLGYLFPSPGEDVMSTVSYIWASSGRGQSVQLAVLPASIIQSAFISARLWHRETCDSFLATIGELATWLGRAASGQNEELPAFVGFNNVSLPEAFETRVGTLRPWVGQGHGFIRGAAIPTGLNGTDMGFVLETTYTYRLIISPQKDADDEPPEMWLEGGERLRLLADTVPLALALAVPRQPPLSCYPAWSLLVDPLSGLQLPATWDQRGATPAWTMSPADCEEAAKWIAILDESDREALEIARRRILMALTTRQDPADAFIDAVIAWENMFGRSGGEIGFSLSLVMAWLLSPDADERLDLQRQISRQYHRRSKVVHGETHLSPTEARTERDTALTRGLMCLRRLYEEFPSLLKDQKRLTRLLALLSAGNES